MKLLATLILAAALAPVTVQAQSLRTALSEVPEAALAFDQAEMFAYVDIQAVLAIGGEPFNTLAARRYGVAGSIRPMDAVSMTLPRNFGAAAGIELAAIHSLAGYGVPPSRTALWQFVDPADATTLFDALGADAFSEIEPGIIANGVPGQMDIGAREPLNPWRGAIGQTSVVAVHEGFIVQTDQVAALQAVLSAERTALDNPAVATALAGLETVAVDGEIVGAMLFSPAAGMGALPLDTLMQGDPEAVADALEALGASGIPPFALGFAADVGLGAPALVISLAYPDCDIAKSAAKQMEAAWPAQSSMIQMATVTSVATQEGEVGCAAMFTALQQDGDAVENHPFMAFLNGFYQRELPLLQIGG